MITIKLQIRTYSATSATPAKYSAAVSPHAKEPPSCAGSKAWNGWREKEEAHQARHRTLIREAIPACPASFDFEGYFRPDQEQEIARKIIDKLGTDVTKYPKTIEVEIG